MPSPQKFIRRGYFPKEAPPAFKTASLAKALNPSVTGFPLKDAFQKLDWSWMMGHSLARAGAVRRSLGVPHPGNHWALAKEIADHWNVLREHTRKSRLSLSVPTLRGTQGRAAVPATPLSDVMFARARTRAGGRYLLRADVAEFYRSVYTHSIPWALHSKAAAKAQMRDKSLLGNRLDAAVQAAQYGQTNGIPVGPDTSLVLAEVILSAIDQALEALLGRVRGHRHYDDYELVFGSAREAEEGKAGLQTALLDFGLHLNPLKTELVELPTSLVSDWWVHVRHFEFSTTRDTGTRVIEFFNDAFIRKASHPDEYVMAYAFGRIEHEPWSDRAWRILEPLLHQAVTAEPSSIHKFVRILVRLEVNGKHVNRSLLADTIDRTILEHAPYGHASEVAWMLWAALLFEVRLTEAAARAVSRMADSFVAILALDAKARNLAPNVDVSQWAGLMTSDALDGDMWLLSYEARVRRWLPTVGGGDHVAANPVFAFLARAKVRFYSRMRTLTRRTLRKLEETDAAAYSDDWDWLSLPDEEDEEEDSKESATAKTDLF